MSARYTATVLLLLASALPLLTQPILFGLCREGGTSNDGVLFGYYTAPDTLVNEVSFEAFDRGQHPVGRLLLTDAGKIYGCTELGGGLNTGVLFEWDPVTGVFIRRISFIASSLGSMPTGVLTRVGNTLYGLAASGGINDAGTLYEYDLDVHVMVKRADLEGVSRGSTPIGGLVAAGNGKLYGLCSAGGNNDHGTLFEYDPATNAFTKRVDFNNVQRGRRPVGELLVSSTGRLYGMTQFGGTSGNGVLFRFNPTNNSYTKLHDLAPETSGADAIGLLTEGPDGRIYGMTRAGGTSGQGTLLAYDPSDGTVTTLHHFNAANGSEPAGAPAFHSDDQLVGSTRQGGAAGEGVLFMFHLGTGTYSTLQDFHPQQHGRLSHGMLHRSADGTLYTLMQQGGTSGQGTLLRWDGEECAKLGDFNGTDLGDHPLGDLLELCVPPIYDSLPGTATVCPWDAYTMEVVSLNSTAVTWFRNGKVRAIGNSLSLDPVTLGDAGIYVAVLENSCGTITSNTFTLVVDACSGIIGPEAPAGFRIYPNPANDKILIDTAEELGLVALYDGTGRQQLLMHASGAAQLLVPIQDLPPGVYMVRAQVGEAWHTMRIVIAR